MPLPLTLQTTIGDNVTIPLGSPVPVLLGFRENLAAGVLRSLFPDCPFQAPLLRNILCEKVKKAAAAAAENLSFLRMARVRRFVAKLGIPRSTIVKAYPIANLVIARTFLSGVL
jgi:hypothetical protein